MSVVIDLNSSAVHAGFSFKESPDVSINPVYYNNDDPIFDPIPTSSTTTEPYTIFNDGILYNASITPTFIRHIYSQLNVSDESLPLVIAQNAWFDRKQLSKLSEIVFEDLEVPIFQIHERQLCTAYALAKPDVCLVVDIDSDYASSTPIVSGKVIRRSITRSHYAGDFLGACASKLLNLDNDENLNYSTAYSKSQEMSDIIHAALDTSDNDYVTLKGKNFSHSFTRDVINKSLLEPLFRPHSSLLGVPQDALGLGQLVLKSLQNTNTAPAALLSSLVVQGPYASAPSLEDALLSDIRLYVKDHQLAAYRSTDAVERITTPWMGANILSQFKDLNVTKQMYSEDPEIFARRIFG